MFSSHSRTYFWHICVPPKGEFHSRAPQYAAPPDNVATDRCDVTAAGASRPRIVEHPDDVLVARNEPATLNCKADGDPAPTITWYRDGHAVTTADDNPLSHRMLLPTGQLFFLRVVQTDADGPPAARRSDVGRYYCKATDPVTGSSVVSRTASLSVAGQSTGRIAAEQGVVQSYSLGGAYI